MLLISPGISERGPDTPRKSTKVAPYPLHRQPCSVSLSILSHNSACVHRVASTRTGAKKIWQAMMEKQLPRQRLSWIIMKNSPNPAKQMHKCLLKRIQAKTECQNKFGFNNSWWRTKMVPLSLTGTRPMSMRRHLRKLANFTRCAKAC